jgi:hypothetical protein
MAVEVIEIKDANGVTQRVYVDKIGTDNVQVVKLGYGNDDALTLASSTNPMPVNVVAGSAAGTEYTEGATDTTSTGTAILWEDAGDTLRTVSAATPMPIKLVPNTLSLQGEAHVGQVGGTTVVLVTTPTVSNAVAYSTGDQVGAKLTFTNAVRIISGSGLIVGLTVVDIANQKAPLSLIIFDADFTGQTDNAAWVWNSADYNKVLGVINVATVDYQTIGSIAIANVTGLSILAQANGTANLYGVLVTTGAPTYTSTSALRLRLALMQD